MMKKKKKENNNCTIFEELIFVGTFEPKMQKMVLSRNKILKLTCLF